MKKIKTALISVSDKKNLKPLLNILKKNKIKIISSGGTYKEIKKLKFKCLEVSKFTNSPEILEGRVKTLHPKIHAGILNKREKKSHLKNLTDNHFENIDLVIVNFYPFENTLKKTKSHKKIIENIDVGGPAMVRSAAKNYNDVTVVTSTEQYPELIDQLKIKDYRLLKSDYGLLPDINSVREGCDLCFTLNGTTSGVRVPNLDWIPLNRDGLVLCDATSAVFAQKIEWNKVDATTFSWQKSMGGEGAHGMLVLSPKAIKRLEEYNPERPLPKIFRLVKNGKLIEEIFSGDTINTPSMFCVADALDSLNWIKALGGLDVTVARATKNFETLQAWLNTQDWIKNLVGEETHRSTTSVCLKIVAEEFLVLSEDKQRQFVKYFVSLLENERVAFDIAGHREAPPGLRIWCGATIENEDLQRLLPWLEWAFTCAKLMFVKT